MEDKPTTIKAGAKFESFKEFETVLEQWKIDNYHPFRVASSETLRMPDGSMNDTFKYRYIVYHCAHYGTPRMRGVGKRPNQNYMPCGCRAMLRLNYSWTENALRVTTLNIEHTGHEVSAAQYSRFASKSKRQCVSLPNTPIPATTPTSTYCNENTSTSPKVHCSTVRQQSVSPTAQEQSLSNLQQMRLSLFASRQLAAPKFDFYPNANFFHLNTFLQLIAAEQQRKRQNLQFYANNFANNNNLQTTYTKVVDDQRSDDERFSLMHPVLQNLTDHLLSLQGKEFDERMEDLKEVLSKWSSLSTGANGNMVDDDEVANQN